MPASALSPETVKRMESLGIDVALSTRILENFNSGVYDNVVPVKVTGVPAIDGAAIIDVTGDISVRLDTASVRTRFRTLVAGSALAKSTPLDGLDPVSLGKPDGTDIVFDGHALTRLGVLLYPLLGYGVLNGGSASSYIDRTKNESFNPVLFRICTSEFESIQTVSKGKAKGITPAFINTDGTPGPSFLELKMRSLLIESLRYRALARKTNTSLGPMFQMTSVYNNDEIAKTYAGYKKSPLLADLIAEAGFDVTGVLTGVQPMLSAFTHSSHGKPKGFFLEANSEPGKPLPMPGGHGQNFIYLADTYRRLHAEGKRFAYLGNVDNLGFTVNPICLALMALNGKQAGFEFAFKTPVDVKGGVLVYDQEKRLNCADIGAAISKDEIRAMESRGEKILFNAATGLFNLDYLAAHIEEIARKLPMRISDQEKDAGKYAQAEQVTWEVIGILDAPVIFGVDKYTRFLASKLLLEGLMSSGIGIDDPSYPTAPDPAKDLRGIALKLSGGLSRQLETTYGLKKEGGAWKPLQAADIVRRLEAEPLQAFLNIQ